MSRSYVIMLVLTRAVHTIPLLHHNSSENSATSGGGGAFFHNAGNDLTIRETLFDGNTVQYADASGGDGGALYNNGGALYLANSEFRNNTALGGFGGGLFNNGPNGTQANVKYFANRAVFQDGQGGSGGGLFHGGSNLKLANGEFSGNVAMGGSGGGLFMNSLDCTLTNSTFAGNSATVGNANSGRGGGAYFSGNNVAVVNGIFWGNSSPTEPQIGGFPPIVSYSDVQGGFTGPTNINQDPKFIRNPFTNGPNDTGNLRLQGSSPCINTGDTSFIGPDLLDLNGDTFTNDPLPLDLDGNPRVSDAIVDMGAYETPLLSGNVTGSTSISVLQFQANPATRSYLYYVKVKNTGAFTLAGPLSLALAGLPNGVFLTNAAGVTLNQLPANNPYVSVSPAGGRLAPGQSVVFVLRLTSPNVLTSTLPGTPRVLAGAGAQNR